jgi:hypothetical protein
MGYCQLEEPKQLDLVEANLYTFLLTDSLTLICFFSSGDNPGLLIR